MDHRRAWAAAVSLGGRLYVAGGDGGDISLASAERFDPQRNLWESLPPMSYERDKASAAAMGGRRYVCGGGNSHEAARSVERFDPERNQWETLPLPGISNGVGLQADVRFQAGKFSSQRFATACVLRARCRPSQPSRLGDQFGAPRSANIVKHNNKQ